MSQLRHDSARVSHNTRIVTTLGPDSNNIQLLEDMIRVGGLNVVHFNFSHDTPKFHEENARIICETSKRTGQEIAVLVDLQGPKIHVGKIAGGSTKLNRGKTLVLDTVLEGESAREAVSLDYRDLPNDVAVGDVLQLNDGLLTLAVEAVEGSKIITRVGNNHALRSNKGINKHGDGLSADALTEKDLRDLKTAITIGYDYLTINFVESAEDLHVVRAKVKEEMEGNAAVRPGSVSEIERVEAIENLNEIVLASDGIMVARGDLTVKIDHAVVPALQERIIRHAHELRRFSITATQVMESMITNPVPTRVKASDVANAVLDGTDAVMCSVETAIGAYPFETASQMAIICATAEKEQGSLNGVAEQVEYPEAVSTNLAIVGDAVSVARAVHAEAIVALAESGSAAFEVSHHNITLPIFALASSASAQRRMAMYHGVRPLVLAAGTDHDTALNEAEVMLIEHGILQSGDQYTITSGSKMRESGSTNTLEVLQVK